MLNFLFFGCVPMATLNIMSINVNGLRHSVKRKTLFRKFKEKKFDVICIQESYITDDLVAQWKKEWGGELVHVEGTARSKGQLILFRRQFPYDWKVEHTSARLIVVKLALGSSNVYICNAYAPNASRDVEDFLLETANILNNIEHDKLIVCGDFNTVMNNDIDIISGEKHPITTVESFRKFADSCNLSDAWRLFNTEQKEFTWSRVVKGALIARRLDYIFLCENTVDDVIECNICSFPQSDHRCVYIKLKCANSERGPGYWKLNNSLLKEKDYLDTINTLIESFTLNGEYEDMPNDTKWELLKLLIKEETIQYSKQRAVKNKNVLIQLQADLDCCESLLAKDPRNRDALYKRENILLQIDLFEQERTKSAQTRARMRWVEEGDKNTKFFLNLEKSKANAKLIPKLVLEDNVILTDQFEILNAQKKYYEELYSDDHYSVNTAEETDLFLEHCNAPKLNDEQVVHCEGDVTTEEMANALKNMNNGSSPGLDGLSTEFMKVFWCKLYLILVNAFNTSFQKGTLSYSQSSAVITLVHKGKELPKSNLSSWRPISLTNTDYKILAKCLAIRLSAVIPSIVSDDQVGYVKGRNISTNLRIIDDVIDHLRIKNRTGVLLALDFSKAFDRISKKFMITAFERFGFGPQFVKWVCILMSNTRSRIGYNGWMSEDFDVKCGIRQGCPFSPLAFVIAVELLAISLRTDRRIQGIGIDNVTSDENVQKIMKILLYADDITLFLKDDGDISAVLDILQRFKAVSGLVINRSKSEAMWLGTNKGSKKDFGFKWVNEIKILGIYFSRVYSASEMERNWTDRIHTIKRMICNWEKRNLSYLGKICVIKSLLASQFVFVMQTISIPDKVLTEINTIFFRFLWRKKNCNKKAFEKIKRRVMINEYSKGGLKMIDMKLLQQSFQCEWLIKLSDASHECKWTWIPRVYFSIFGRNFSVLNSTVGAKKFRGLDDIPSLFWRGLLRVWLLNNTRDAPCGPRTECIWNNGKITHQGNVLYFREWAVKGVTYINDLLKNNTVVSLIEIQDMLGPSPALFIQYIAVRQALNLFLRTYSNYVYDNVKEDVTLYFNGNVLKSARMFRINMIEGSTCRPICENFWSHKFEITIDKSYWELASKATKESRLRELQWKILHNIYPTNILLFKMGIRSDIRCTYCNEIDYVEHFFFNCFKINQIWSYVENAFFDKFDIRLSISESEALLGIPKKSGFSSKMINHLNHLILIAKMCVGKFRYGTPIHIQFLFNKELSSRKLS